MEMDYDRYKLFVGGIPRETSEESLKQHFSRYGLVLGAVVAKEKATGHPRGFGFVRFANAYDVDKALRDSHFILGRAVSYTFPLILIYLCHVLYYLESPINELVYDIKGPTKISFGFNCFLYILRYVSWVFTGV